MRAPYILIAAALAAPAVLGVQRRDDGDWWGHDGTGTPDDGPGSGAAASEGEPMTDENMPLQSHDYWVEVSKREGWAGGAGSPQGAKTGKLLFSNDVPRCTAEEQAAVMKLDSVSESIMGRGMITLAADKPAACLPMMAFPEAFNCFYSWGLKQDYAVCWAKWFVSEQMAQCAHTLPFTRQYEKCHESTQALKSEKSECEYNAMGVSSRCQRCHLEAQNWWGRHCRLLCAPGSQPNATAADTPECKTCNSALGALMESCGDAGGSLLG